MENAMFLVSPTFTIPEQQFLFQTLHMKCLKLFLAKMFWTSKSK